MNTSQESPAPSTESSHQPPPIPPIPPIPNSPTPFASPTPPLNLELPTKTLDGRQILKPVAPSKRPTIERPTPSSSHKISTGNAFLPKELAEIVAIRQRHERAWHARIMICTTAISSIESTLANFKEEIEKEEVAAFKAYLQLAIANFAAVDNSPTPPQVPSHSRPTKSYGHGSGKVKTTAEKVAVVVPRNTTGIDACLRKTQGTSSLPKLPETAENTWASVVRKGKKKARTTLSTKTTVVPVRKAVQSETNKDKSPIKDSTKMAITDKRLFVRLPQEHEWRKLSPAGIREVIVKKLNISPVLFGKVKPVQSGFALSPCSTEAREAIINAGNRLFLSGAKLESATNWTPVIIPTVPTTIRKEQGEVEVSKSMLTEEIERVCHIRPAHVKLYGGNKPGAPHRTWMAYFPTAPRSSFRIFDESGIARKFKKQQPIEFCKRCNGHHPTKNCSRAPSCGNCGSTNHTEELCMAATKCRNCGGPHRSDSRRCFARPTRSGAPTKEQLKIYRQAGEREYQAVTRAKAAEKLAASTTTNNVELISSQASEVNNVDNIPASSVDSSTGDAMRL